MAINPLIIKEAVKAGTNKKFWTILIVTILAISLLLLIIILIPIILLIMLFGNNGADITTRVEVNEQVKAYTTVIQINLEKNNLDKEWEDVIKAIMMQESGGKGLDPMQSSECGFNTKYPNKPNGIQDPFYSVEVGIKNFADILNKVNLQKPKDDFNKLKIALQSYNFGSGYISYVNKNGGKYSLENASDFSQKQQENLGWTSYGDVYYVPHVWRYLPISYPNLDGINNINPGDENKLFANPLKTGTYSVTQWYGNNGHKGIDLGASEGTPIYASADGYVSFAGYGTSSNGFNGYGNGVLIDHKNGYYTMYGHAVRLHVTTGQFVKKGQLIAEVGNTGNSFGNHLHFEVRTGYQYPRIDPAQFINF